MWQFRRHFLSLRPKASWFQRQTPKNKNNQESHTSTRHYSCLYVTRETWLISNDSTNSFLSKEMVPQKWGWSSCCLQCCHQTWPHRCVYPVHCNTKATNDQQETSLKGFIEKNLCIWGSKPSNISVTGTHFNPSLSGTDINHQRSRVLFKASGPHIFTLSVTLQELQRKKFESSVYPLAGFEYTAWLFSLTQSANKGATVTLCQHTCVCVLLCERCLLPLDHSLLH